MEGKRDTWNDMMRDNNEKSDQKSAGMEGVELVVRAGNAEIVEERRLLFEQACRKFESVENHNDHSAASRKFSLKNLAALMEALFTLFKDPQKSAAFSEKLKEDRKECGGDEKCACGDDGFRQNLIQHIGTELDPENQKTLNECFEENRKNGNKQYFTIMEYWCFS